MFFFWYLIAQRSLRCFGSVGGILWKYYVVDGYTLENAAIGFGVDNIGSLKTGVCCDYCAEEVLDKMGFIWNSALLVIVSDGGRRVFSLVCFYATVQYLVVAVIMLGAVGIICLWGNHEKVFPIWTELVAGINIWWQL